MEILQIVCYYFAICCRAIEEKSYDIYTQFLQSLYCHILLLDAILQHLFYYQLSIQSHLFHTPCLQMHFYTRTTWWKDIETTSSAKTCACCVSVKKKKKRKKQSSIAQPIFNHILNNFYHVNSCVIHADKAKQNKKPMRTIKKLHHSFKSMYQLYIRTGCSLKILFYFLCLARSQSLCNSLSSFVCYHTGNLSQWIKCIEYILPSSSGSILWRKFLQLPDEGQMADCRLFDDTRFA